MLIQRLLLPLFLLLNTLAASAFGAVLPVAPPPSVDGRGHILLDFHSGKVIAEQNADARMEPASLTKLMTAYTVFHELRSGQIALDTRVRVSNKAWRTPGSRMFIEVNTEVSVEDLLKGMIIQSGNDASVALAEQVAGSEEAFAGLMNRHAQRLGMTNSRFTNSTGLPDAEHYSTPRDLALLAAALIREFPDYYAWYSQKEFAYNGITQHNRNLLLWRDESVDGVKTGHTESAGYCLVSSAQRDGMRLIAAVMGTKSEQTRAAESQKLLNYGFRFYETHKLYDAGQPLKALRAWKGEREMVELGLDQALYVTVPRGQYGKLNAALSVAGEISAPIQKGQSLGTVNVRLGDEVLAERTLIALHDVAEGGLFRRLVDSIKLMF